jgi:N-methylhydantoinase B
MLGLKEWLPLEGAGGGRPGSTTIYEITRGDGSVDRISTKAADVILRAGETFEMRCGSGGGVGDPLRRVPRAVADDVAQGFITAQEADAEYGVVLDAHGEATPSATDARRAQIRADRLARAQPPVKPVTEAAVARLGAREADESPLYLRVRQRGPVAFVAESGTPLAIAPDHWTDGCAVLEERRGGGGPDIVIRSYLDPRTGESLYVEVAPAGEPRSFEIAPTRWTETPRPDGWVGGESR